MYDFSLPVLELAPQLLGASLSHGGVTLRLTEVEAYQGSADPAAHSWAGPTRRNRDLFGPPGTLYCYLSYGIHSCGNLVCGEPGSAVLFRAAQVEAGLDLAQQRRPGIANLALARGPGNLGRVLGWSVSDSGRRFGVDGLDLVPGSRPAAIQAGPRVGVSVAWQRPWRFWIAKDPTVSAYRRSGRIVPGRHDW